MTAEASSERPVLLCYDGSDPAKRAIEEAGRLLGGGPAIVLTVWESVGSAVLLHGPPVPGELGREIREMSEDVIDGLDRGTAEGAEAIAAEGASDAAAAGFDARAEARRALAPAAERQEVTVWRAILHVADEANARVIVLGSRGRSGIKSALLGSVSYGLVHHSSHPLLLLPPPA